MERIIVVSVVRNHAMYSRCLIGNEALTGVEYHEISNRLENRGVAERYNAFLDDYDYGRPSWFVFCHEDFEPCENLSPILSRCDSNCLWGPAGTRVKVRRKWLFGGNWSGDVFGNFEESDKTGEKWIRPGLNIPEGSAVDAFDCMCLIVHSSLVRKCRLRFDPVLTFDLYVEDFCMNAKRSYGIQSRLLPFQCRHWSHGTVTERYHRLRSYLFLKYPHDEIFSAPGYGIGGGRTILRRLQLRLRMMLDNRWPSLAKKLVGIIG